MTPDHGPSRLVLPAVLAAVLAFAAPAALAQSERETFPEALEELPGRVEEAMRGLLDRMKPAIEDTFELMDVLGEIDSPRNYEKPVILPNGDILIRRSADAPEWPSDEPEERRVPRPPHLDPNEGTPI